MKILLLSIIVIMFVLCVYHNTGIMHIKNLDVTLGSIFKDNRTSLHRNFLLLKNKLSSTIKERATFYNIKRHNHLQPNGKNSNRVDIINEALKWQGIKYRYGGTSKRFGTDCSGFVKSVFQTQGVLLPRTANAQFISSKSYEVTYPDYGDVVYFYSKPKRKKVTHCGIVLFGRQFIHASQGCKRVVVNSLIDSYYSTRVAGYRRFIQ